MGRVHIELLGVVQVEVGESGWGLLALALSVILVPLRPCEMYIEATVRHLVNFGGFSFFCNCYLLLSRLSPFCKFPEFV